MSLLSPHAVDAASMQELFLHELKDVYDAEHQILEALPLMIEGASDERLKNALEYHRQETEGHVARLEEVFRKFDMEPQRVPCDGMEGIITEGEHVLKGNMDDAVKDIALIAAAQRVEHYEISAYVSLCELARNTGRSDIADLLEGTLVEERQADAMLASIGGEIHNTLS